MAKLIQPDGTETLVQPKNGSDFQYQELHDMVNGYIEIVRPLYHPQYTDHIMVINEEGKLEGLGVNEKATAIWLHDISHSDYIVGPALICKEVEVK